MKILEAQNSVLTNYEVYTHLLDSKRRFQARHKREHRRAPKNYQVVTKDVIQYCQTHPCPLSQEPLTYTPESVANLVDRLGEHGLSKGEMLMIANLRPTDLPSLHVCVEELSERYTDDQQARMLEAVVEVLGRFPPASAEGGGAGEEGAQGDGHQQHIAQSIENGTKP